METNKIEKVTPRGSQNILLCQISEKYSVVFYTISRYIVFQYCWDDGIDFYPTNRGDVLFWISQEEKEKLFAFEREKKKEFQTRVVYDTPEDDIKKIDENKKMRKEYNARGERTYENSINRENAKK